MMLIQGAPRTTSICSAYVEATLPNSQTLIDRAHLIRISRTNHRAVLPHQEGGRTSHMTANRQDGLPGLAIGWDAAVLRT